MTRPHTPSRGRRTALVSGLFLAAALVACPRAAAPPAAGAAGRSYRKGFSGSPPRPDLTAAVAAIRMWTRRADAAMIHLEPPWKLLLSGGDYQAQIRTEYVDLAAFYRSRNLPIFVTFDLTDGLAREREARELREAGRSLAEPAVQQRFRAYLRAWLAAIRPEYVGLGAEVNLIRLAAPRPVYDAVRTLASAAAEDARLVLPTATLYTTVQVDVAWGRLQGTNTYTGTDEDFRDFPFIQALGLSAYPYLARFATPEDVPLDYLSRLRGGRNIPVFVAEGGWSSTSVGGGTSPVPPVKSSPALQARYVRRMHELLEHASAIACLQLTFADMDPTAFSIPPDAQATLALFLTLGFTDSGLHPKAALAEWDSLFTLPRRPGG